MRWIALWCAVSLPAAVLVGNLFHRRNIVGLILTRRSGEAIHLGDAVVLTALNVQRSRTLFEARCALSGNFKIISLRVGEHSDHPILGKDVAVQLMKIVHGRAYINVRAPNELKVFRGEIYERIQAEKVLNYLAQQQRRSA